MRKKSKKPRPNVWKNEHCPKYNVAEEGHGDPSQWVHSFKTRMGLDEAEQILGQDDPILLLGLQPGFNKKELHKAFRAAAMRWHPDRPGGDESMFKKMQAAYVKLGG